MLFKVLVDCHSEWFHLQLDGTLTPFDGEPDLHLGGNLGLVFDVGQKKDNDSGIGMAITVVDRKALCRVPRNGSGGNELVIACNNFSMIFATKEQDSDEMNVTETACTPLVVARWLAEIGAKEGSIMTVRYLGRHADDCGRFFGLVWI